MAGLANDFISRLNQMAADRSDYDAVWRQVSDVAAPDAGEFGLGLDTVNLNGDVNRANAARRSRKIFDSTAVWAVDRLASGVEGLVIPASEYWHNYEIGDLAHAETNDDEARYLERLRNLTFKVRYDADSGWIPASQTCFRRLCAFGNAFMFVEDSADGKSMVKYRYMPLNECYVAENHQGQIDTFYRLYTLTARQAVQKFGEECSESVKRAAASTTDTDRKFKFVQCIQPRSDYSSAGIGQSAYSSVHIEVDAKKIVRTSGYFTFPVVDFRWLPEPGKVYGESPVMKALADIQSLNAMAKNELLMSQQAVNPTLLVANAGVMNRPRAHPGAMILGGINSEGRRMVDPMFNAQRLDFASQVLDSKREQVKQSMYLNLFQVLVEHPQMTATEAMIRNGEKAALLGPAGLRIQQSLSNLVEREVDIMTRAGLYSRNSAFLPPPSLRGRNLTPQFSGPISRLRRSSEGEGIMNLINALSPLAAIDESVTDTIDAVEAARELADIFGAPKKVVRRREDFDAIQRNKQQPAVMGAQAKAARDIAAAGKDGATALETLQAF